MPPRKRAAYLKKLADAKVAKVAKEENHEPGDSREIASVCLLLRHFIHVTDNFCHLFCPFSQVVPWSSPAAPDFLSLLSPVSSLFCSVLSLLSSLLSSLFPLLVSRWIPSSIPRVLSNCLLALLSPCPSPLSALPLSPCCPSSLFSPRSPLLA